MSQPSKRELAEVIRALSKKVPDAKLAKTIARYLVEERRTGELDAIMREVIRQRQEEDSVAEATISSAFPLKASVKKQLADLVDAKTTVINETIDPDLLGGVRMETNEQLLDLTVRNRLDHLKQGVQN